MKFKSVEGLDIYVTQEGKIALEQNSFEFGEPVRVFLTLEQFKSLYDWVLENEEQIDVTWNGGVCDGES